jgi:hypothetical protein
MKEEVEDGIQRMASGKARDIEELQAEHSRWGKLFSAKCITALFNQLIKEGFPDLWLTSLILPIFKRSKTNDTGNYKTHHD